MKFINPESIVANMGLKTGNKVADFGSGAGFYTVAASKIVGNTGRVAAIDVQDSKLTATKSMTVQKGLHNVEVYKADLEKPFDQIPHGTEDAVILASIIHEVHNREALFKNAYALLKSKGLLLAVDWQTEHSPFGPAMDKRISAQDLRAQLEALGLKHIKDLNGELYHYAMVFEKQ